MIKFDSVQFISFKIYQIQFIWIKINLIQFNSTQFRSSRLSYFISIYLLQVIFNPINSIWLDNSNWIEMIQFNHIYLNSFQNNLFHPIWIDFNLTQVNTVQSILSQLTSTFFNLIQIIQSTYIKFNWIQMNSYHFFPIPFNWIESYLI